MDHPRAARIGAISALALGLLGPASAPGSPTTAAHDPGHSHGDGIECGPSPASGIPILCVHGEDPPPAGANVDDKRTVAELAAATEVGVAAAGSATTSCVGNGTDGKRVQAMYVVAGDTTNRSTDIVPLIRQWAAITEASFVDSAAQTGGVRRVRWVHDENCVLDVDVVVVSATADDTFSATITALQAAGYGSANRKYMLWVDANVYCGIAQLYTDDSETNNYNDGTFAMYARSDNGCWGYSYPNVEAHELMHNLGAVQSNSPNHSPYGHCLDDKDTMCYADGPGVVVSMACPRVENERLFDCNKDDYFSTSPALGSYLDSHWNTADSGFLHSGPAAPSPDPPTNPGVVTTSARWTGTLTAAHPSVNRWVTPDAGGEVSVRLRVTPPSSSPAAASRLRVFSDGTLVADSRHGAGFIRVHTTASAGTRLRFFVTGAVGTEWALAVYYSTVAS